MYPKEEGIIRFDMTFSLCSVRERLEKTTPIGFRLENGKEYENLKLEYSFDFVVGISVFGVPFIFIISNAKITVNYKTFIMADRSWLENTPGNVIQAHMGSAFIKVKTFNSFPRMGIYSGKIIEIGLVLQRGTRLV